MKRTADDPGVGRRSAARTILGWSTALGLAGALATVLASVVLRADLRSALWGVGLALAVTVAGLVAVFPIARAGQMAFVLALLLYATQVFAMFAAAGQLRDHGWIHARPFAFSALAAVLAWQAGATVGFVRARTPLIDLAAGAR